MGRYYSGDIEGKFWFGVQSSDDANFFGGERIEPHCINYFFDKSHLKSIVKSIEICKKVLGKNKNKFDNFFKENIGYTDEMISKKLHISLDNIKKLLVWYARLELGNKILVCVKKQNTCSFEAEI